MTLFVLAYLGGILTIISPCILPVIPFVLARADRPFLRDGLPILIGMALAFAVVASLASVAGGWVVSANEYGRLAALVLLAAFGLTLVFPGLADPRDAANGRHRGAYFPICGAGRRRIGPGAARTRGRHGLSLGAVLL
jgi:cytochrome c biogenesis protein CcdA